MTWVDRITTAVVQGLESEYDDIIFHIENMDSKRNPSPAYQRTLYALYKQKFAGVSFDLILASDNNAFDFLRTYREDLFGEVPVVFGGVNDFSDDQIADIRNFTGVAEVFDAARTVEQALKNHPGTKEIFIINDYLKTGRAWENDIRKQLRPLSASVQFTYAENYTLEELEEHIANLPPHALVLLGVYFSDRDGRYLTYEQVGKMLSRKSRVPVYCLLNFNIGDGVVGGNVIDGFSQGQAMAEIGLRILKGEDPNGIPVVKTGVNRNIYNYKEMVRFNIDEKSLPPDSVFINKPSPVYQVDKRTAWMAVLIIGCVVSLILWLSYLLVKNERIKRRLKESEAYNRTIFEESPIGLAFCGLDGELLDVNSAYAGILGYPAEELIGRSYMEFTPQGYEEQEDNKLEMLKKHGRFGPFEKQYRNRAGELVPIRVSCAMLGSPKGQYNLASVENISQEKQDQIRAAQMSHLASMGELAAGVAHEINNPINGVINYAQLCLNRYSPPGEGEEFLRRIIKEGKRVADIVKNLLHYSHQNSSPPELVNLQDVLSEALTLFSAQLQKEGISLDVEVEGELPPVYGRFTELERVLINLVSNSRYALNQKYGPETDPLKVLTISLSTFLQEDQSYVRMCVKDSGVGIPEQIIDKVFNPFLTTKPSGDGTGLGLNICHQIISDHNGMITIESRENDYTHVMLDLPVAE